MSAREKWDQLQALNPFNTATQWHNSSTMCLCVSVWGRERETAALIYWCQQAVSHYTVCSPKATAITVKSILSINLMVTSSTSSALECSCLPSWIDFLVLASMCSAYCCLRIICFEFLWWIIQQNGQTSPVTVPTHSLMLQRVCQVITLSNPSTWNLPTKTMPGKELYSTFRKFAPWWKDISQLFKAKHLNKEIEMKKTMSLQPC